MDKQVIKESLVRQWRLMEQLRGHPQGRSMQALMKALKVSKGTIEGDLGILEEAGLPFTRKLRSGEFFIRYEGNTSSASTSQSDRTAQEGSTPETRASRAAKKNQNTRTVLTLAPSNALAILNEAIEDEADVHISYVLSGTIGVVSGTFAPLLIHTVDEVPYLLVEKGGMGYGFIEVARITELHEAGFRSAWPPYDEGDDSALSDLFEADIGQLVTVTVRMTPWAKRFIDEYPLTLSQVVQSLPDGGITVTGKNVGTVEALRWVLSWGGDAEVLEPRSLRESVVGELRRTLASTLKTKIDELKAERDSLTRDMQHSD